MAYASNCPISGPRHISWEATWDIGGMAWSHDWGMFYNVSAPDEQAQLIPPRPPSQG